MSDDTAQTRWIDANIRHQIGLLRVSGSLRDRVIRLLDATEADLRHAIGDRLRHYKGGRPSDVERKQKLLSDLEEIRGAAWLQARGIWVAELQAIAVAEPRFMDALLQTVLPVVLDNRLPPASALRAIVTARPFEGRTLRQWADKVQRADVERIQSQIQIGLVQGEDLPTISRRIVGSVRLRGTEGATALTRADVEGLTRTAVNHTANQARAAFFAENTDLGDTELFIATLDSRTTPVCRGFDGERFRVGTGPVPPLHFRCRSLRTLLLDPEPLGERPFNPTTERQLVREFAEREGFAPPRDRDGLPRGTRGAFDRFSRARVRELIGQVPARTTYAEFLRRQTVEFQNEVMGPTRARLFRTGQIELQGFVDRKGANIPLTRLAKMHADAFRAAGLDPAEFLTR